MDHRKTENVDIEKCKELFAYEMTQVVLMLKGEFATVSGKELGYAQHHVSQEARNVPVEVVSQSNIPAVQTQSVGVSQEITEKCAAPLAAIEQTRQNSENDGFCVAVSKPELELPQVSPGAYAYKLPEAQRQAPCHVELPQVCPLTVQPPAAVAYSNPQVTMPAVPAAPQTTFPQVAVTCCQVEVPAVPAAPQATIPQVAVTCCQVEVPAAPQRCTEVSAVESKPITVEIPHVQKILPVVSTSVQVTQVTVQVAIPDIPAVSVAPVRVQTGSVSIPKVSKVAMPQITRAAPVSAAPELPEIAPVKQPPVIPAMPKIAVAQTQVTVPDLPRYEVQQKIQPTRLQKLSDIPVPPRPDISKERSEILSAFANEF